MGQGYEKALNILKENREKLVEIAEALLIKETLHKDEIQRIMAGENVVTEDEIAAYKKRIEVAKNWSKDHHGQEAGGPSVSNENQRDSSQPLDPLTQAT